MCGIYFGCVCESCRKHIVDISSLQRRGPDATTDVFFPKNDAAPMRFRSIFTRLCIQGVTDGAQPFSRAGVHLIVNGEIYNSKQLMHDHKIVCDTKSDCEVILGLYLKYGIEHTVNEINDQYAFVIHDERKNVVIFGRDIVGKMPLYYAVNDEKCLSISSMVAPLLKSSQEHHIQHVLPARYYIYDIGTRTLSAMQYWIPVYLPIEFSDSVIAERLIESVEERVGNCEREYGFLLSGGLDSSAILALAMQTEIKLPVDVYTFGFSEKAPDVIAAATVVDYLRGVYGADSIRWHCIIKPIEDGLTTIPEVISAIETYDTTTIRASVPMLLLCEEIRKTSDIRVLISGEGSDELFGGYRYFQYAPNDFAFRAEIIKRLERIYLYDALRADRCISYYGMEMRAPFLAEKLINSVLNSTNLQLSSKNSKQLLRDILATLPHNDAAPLLPKCILDGKKEAFSDAVGVPQDPSRDWKTQIKLWCQQLMLEHKEIGAADCINPRNPPQTDEEKCFQYLFHKKFGPCWQILDEIWLPNQDFIATGREPSATVLPNYAT